MALASTVVWEVRTTGDDTNGGGFNSASAGTDYSQQNTPVLTVTDAATSGVGSTTLTSATGGFTSAMVGSVLHLYGGTNLTEGWYEITGYTDTNTVTLDRAPDDGLAGVSGATCKVGGALGSPGGLGAALTNASTPGQSAWIAGGTYTLTTSTPNTSQGPLELPTYTELRIRGYGSIRGDNGKPIIHAGALTALPFMVSLFGYYINDSQVVQDLICDGNNGSGNVGFLANRSGYLNAYVYRCEANNCAGAGFSGSQLAATFCKASNCSTGFSTIGGAYACYSVGGSRGFVFSAVGTRCAVVRCVANGCSIAGFDQNTGYEKHLFSCTAYGCGDGFLLSGYDINQVADCLAVSNSGYGFNTPTGQHTQVLFNCSGYNNTSGNYRTGSDQPILIDWLTITGDPFVDAANGDFRLNDTPGAGAVLRGAGLGVYGQTDNQDVGAVQHSDPAGGGWPYPRIRCVGG